MSKFARNSKNCKKLEKWQFLLKLRNSSGKSLQKLRKLEKSLKLVKISVEGGTRVPSKNYDFCKIYEKLEKSQFLLKLIN